MLRLLLQSLTQGCSFPSKVNKTTLLDFFRNPDNFSDKDIETITKIIGPWDCYDDWDWGRVPYEWRRKDLRLVVMTQGGCINSVMLLDPNDLSRFDSAVIEVLWERYPSEDASLDTSPDRDDQRLEHVQCLGPKN